MSSYASKNVRYLRKLRGWTQDQFANKLNIKRSLLGAYEEARAEPKLDVLLSISKMFKLSLDDLLTKDLTISADGTTYMDRRRLLKMTESHSAEIALVPVKAAAGYLAGYADPEFIDELNTFTLPMLSGGLFRAFEIVGDSMLPTPSGSIVIGEKVDNLTAIKNNDPYVVVSRNSGIVYKRVSRPNRAQHILTLISDNSMFEPYQLPAEEVLELWQVQYILSRANNHSRWDVEQLAGLVSNLQQQVATLNKKVQ